jgi:hypothetical protein
LTPAVRLAISETNINGSEAAREGAFGALSPDQVLPRSTR